MLRNPGHRILLGCMVLAALFALFTLFPCSGDETPSPDRPGVLKTGPADGAATRADFDRAWSEDRDPVFDEDASEASCSDVDAPEPPRRNINRLFMVLGPENGMGPPPGVKTRR